jgi:hypothetical protein
MVEAFSLFDNATLPSTFEYMEPILMQCLLFFYQAEDHSHCFVLDGDGVVDLVVVVAAD